MTAPDSDQAVRAALSCRPYRVLRVSAQRPDSGCQGDECNGRGSTLGARSQIE